uniref:MIR domain-containing protein n=1 Tax=Setaria italica TaxID=4555 RepID=A0A0Q3SSZ4_SETIT
MSDQFCTTGGVDKHRRPTQTRQSRCHEGTGSTTSNVAPGQHASHAGTSSFAGHPLSSVAAKNTPPRRGIRLPHFPLSRAQSSPERVKAERPEANLPEAKPPRGHDPAAVAPSTPQPPQGLSRRRAASADNQPNTSGAATASLAGALTRERIRRRGEADAGPGGQEALPFWQKTWFLALLLAMAAASFALALLLYLGLDLPEAAPAQSYAADPDTVVEITYGSVIKLMHERTKFRLHSHDVPYGSGSGQQSVTSFPNVDDANSYW